MTRLRRPLSSPSFRRLLVGKTVSYLGDWLMVAALVGWIYESTSSVAQVALLMAIRLVPPILGGGVAAAVVDRFPRKRVLVAAEAACAATVAGALVGVATGLRPLVFALVGLCGLASMISAVAANALLPMVVEEDQLAAANGLHGVGQDAAMAAGALVGGVTLAFGGAGTALAANLASYVLAVALYARLTPRGDCASRRGRATSGLGSGLRYVLSQRTVLGVVGAMALATLATGLVNATLPRFTVGLGLGAGGYGYALAALAVGMLVGEASVGAAADRVEARWLAPALGGMAILFGALALSPDGTTALILMAAFGVANGAAEVVLNTAIQQEAAAAYHGRVFGISLGLWRTTMLGAVVAVPLVNAVATPAQAIVGAAVSVAAGAVVAAVALGRAPLPLPDAA